MDKFRNATVALQEALARREAAGRVGLFQGGATLPGPLAGQPLRGWTKNRHFRVGSSRNIPDITLPRLLELAVFASSRGTAEFVHAA
ncbi:hypothetical protein [Novosphingobium sp. AAP1]|uniref:hypothetical protein n=1 Tax=Novosphingobium sp. AAP1 TaxID=1523413 RepID=UPI0018D081C1|nr:hypothetical protein [Novosphingobium sp. AAP1]